MAHRIDRTWEAYAKLVLPADATPAMRERCRQDFFAGACVLYQAMMEGISAGPDITPEDDRFMVEIDTELSAFGLALDMKYLGRVLLGKGH